MLRKGEQRCVVDEIYERASEKFTKEKRMRGGGKERIIGDYYQEEV